MNKCSSCGGRLDDCNESQIVCPWCGEPDCWPRFLDEGGEFDRNDSDWDRDEGSLDSIDRDLRFHL